MAQSDELKELWREYRGTKSNRVRDALVNAYMPIITNIATKMKARLPANVMLEDLVSSGLLGLFDAIRKFQPKRDVKFESYAGIRIQGAMIDDLRRSDWIPRSARKQIKRLADSLENLEKTMGRPPSFKEICEEFNVSRDEMSRFLAEMPKGSIQRLDGWHPNQMTESKSNHFNPFEIIDHRNEPQDQMSEKKNLEEKLLEQLLPEERRIFILRYKQNLSFEEIARSTGRSKNQVDHIHRRMLEKIGLVRTSGGFKLRNAPLRVGRPPLPDNRRARHQILLKLSEPHFRLLQKRASMAKLSPQDWLRRMIIKSRRGA